MVNKIGAIARSIGAHQPAERLVAAGLAEVSDHEDPRVGQVGEILAETLGLVLDPEAHVVLGQAVLHVKRALAGARASAREGG